MIEEFRFDFVSCLGECRGSDSLGTNAGQEGADVVFDRFFIEVKDKGDDSLKTEPWFSAEVRLRAPESLTNFRIV